MADRSGASPTALAITEFQEVLVPGEFQATLKFEDSVFSYDGLGRQTDQFVSIGETDAFEHTPGADIGGTSIPSEARTIPFDSKELVAAVWESNISRFNTHFEYRSAYAQRLGYAVAKQVNSRTARMIALGARQDARTVTGSSYTFKGGNLVWRNAATLAAAYPLSAIGSRNIQDDLAAVRVLMQNKDCDFDQGQPIAYMDFDRINVLARDNTIQSKEYIEPGTNRLLYRIVSLVEGFRIVGTSQMPNSNVTTGESAYQGDFSKVAILCAWGKMGVGKRMAEGITADGPTWHGENRSWLMQAAHYSGIKWLQPAHLAEIHIGTSDYTLSNGVYAP